MDYLKEIVSIVDRSKIKNIEILGNDKSKGQKLNLLYDGILSGELQTDGQACRKLYQTNDMTKGYRNLKSRLERRAINTLFFIDLNVSIFSDFHKAYLNSYKNLAAIKFLLGKGARKASIKLAEKTLEKTLKYDIHEVSIPLLKDLRYYYGTLIGDLKKFNRYNQLLKKLLEDIRYDDRACEMYDTLASQFVHSKAIKPAHIELAREYAQELETYLDKTTYRNFHIFAHLILVLRYQIENNHEKTVQACDRALSYLQKIEHTTDAQKFSFLFKKLTSHIQLKQFKLADEDAKTCLTLVEVGSVNWFIISQFHILMLFHSERFQEAFEFYKEVRTIRRRKKGRLEIGKEFFNIIEAYVDYFIRVGKISIPADSRKPRFDSKSFIKSKPAFSKDKRGMNVTILVLQILFLLNENKFDDVISRTETLKTYSSRYLRQDETFRSNCFIKMLSKISEANFNRIALERRTNDLFQRLKSKPLEVANQPIEMEIVPFEILWELVLESLEKKRKLRRQKK